MVVICALTMSLKRYIEEFDAIKDIRSTEQSRTARWTSLQLLYRMAKAEGISARQYKEC